MLKTGYNLVRGHAIRDFHADIERRYGLKRPYTLSTIALLRHIHRRQSLPHAVVAVTGFPDLWRFTPPDQHDELTRWLYRLCFHRMNWLQNENPYLYVLLPDDVTFQYAAHLQLRLSADVYADMTDVFGHLTQENTAHYHHNFNVSQV